MTIQLLTYAVMLTVALYCAAALYLAPARARGLVAIGSFGLTGLLILAVAVLPTLTFHAPRYLHDLWTVFDVASKASAGVASSRDYFSPIGPAYDWVFRLTLLFRPLSATVVASASAVFAALTVVLALAMLIKRVSPLALAMTCLIAVATIVSPRDVDRTFVEASASWLAPYNRWAWGLLVPVVMTLCSPHRRMGWLGSTALGVALALLLLLKVTYGVAALGLLVVCVVLRHRGLLEGLVTLVSVLVTLAVAEGLSHQVLAYVADLRVTADFTKSGLRIRKLIVQLGEMLTWVGLALALWLLFMQQTQTEASRWRRLLPALLIVTAAAMSNLILMQNHFTAGSPIYVLLPLIAAEWTGLLAFRSMPMERVAPRLDTVLLLLLIIVLPVPLLDVGQIATQYAYHFRFLDHPSRALTAQGDLVLHHSWLTADPCEVDSCEEYRSMLTGLDALRELGADQPGAGRVLAVNFSNPFPFFLSSSFPEATPIWLHPYRSYSETSLPPADVMFADVGYVMVTVETTQVRNVETMFAVYGDYLAQEFTEAARLDDWVVYVRR